MGAAVAATVAMKATVTTLATRTATAMAMDMVAPTMHRRPTFPRLRATVTIWLPTVRHPPSEMGLRPITGQVQSATVLAPTTSQGQSDTVLCPTGQGQLATVLPPTGRVQLATLVTPTGQAQLAIATARSDMVGAGGADRHVESRRYTG